MIKRKRRSASEDATTSSEYTTPSVCYHYAPPGYSRLDDLVPVHSASAQPIKMASDEYQVFGDHVASELRSIANEKYVQKLKLSITKSITSVWDEIMAERKSLSGKQSLPDPFICVKRERSRRERREDAKKMRNILLGNECVACSTSSKRLKGGDEDGDEDDAIEEGTQFHVGVQSADPLHSQSVTDLTDFSDEEGASKAFDVFSEELADFLSRNRRRASRL